MNTSHPVKQGLYDPQFEHDACGIGFIAQMKGAKSQEIVTQALTILVNLDHRGACGCETNTGDGAGILMQVPHKFMQKVAAAEGIELPAAGQYGVGAVYGSPDPATRSNSRQIFAEVVAAEGLKVLGWRDVPTDNGSLGETARWRSLP
jgi:glutamate synthase (ferredoxin)